MFGILGWTSRGDRPGSNRCQEGHGLSCYLYTTVTRITIARDRVELSFAGYQPTVLPLNYQAALGTGFEPAREDAPGWLTASCLAARLPQNNADPARIELAPIGQRRRLVPSSPGSIGHDPLFDSQRSTSGLVHERRRARNRSPLLATPGGFEPPALLVRSQASSSVRRRGHGPASRPAGDHAGPVVRARAASSTPACCGGR